MHRPVRHVANSNASILELDPIKQIVDSFSKLSTSCISFEIYNFCSIHSTLIYFCAFLLVIPELYMSMSRS